METKTSEANDDNAGPDGVEDLESGGGFDFDRGGKDDERPWGAVATRQSRGTRSSPPDVGDLEAGHSRESDVRFVINTKIDEGALTRSPVGQTVAQG